MKAIVFAGENGRCALYGDVDHLPDPKESVTIRNVRMVLRVAKVGFVGLAGGGPEKGTDTRITRPAPETKCVAQQSLACTPEASALIDAWPNWE